MPEIVEFWGQPVELPEPKIVGTCHCGLEVHDYEATYCPLCDSLAHPDCFIFCAFCERQIGCGSCIGKGDEIFANGDWFCGEEHRDEFNEGDGD